MHFRIDINVHVPGEIMSAIDDLRSAVSALTNEIALVIPAIGGSAADPVLVQLTADVKAATQALTDALAGFPQPQPGFTPQQPRSAFGPATSRDAAGNFRDAAGNVVPAPAMVPQTRLR
jgi:hypothetical protein